MQRRCWSRKELILAINLYCKTPFGRIHQRNPDIIKLSRMINRTPGAVAWKMCNFASIDPSLERKGASNVAKLDIEVWNEFFDNWEDLVIESETILVDYEKKIMKDSEVAQEIRKGQDKKRLIKTRVNQSFFRQTVLSSYDFKCCITGISIPGLLIGSHIIPWSHDIKNRLNPRNGLCLNALHDKAFDKGLLTISDDLMVILSSKIKKNNTVPVKMFLLEYEGKAISLPQKFLPNRKFLKYHRENIFVA